MRKVQGLGGPDLPCFDPSVAQRGGFNEIRRLARLKIEDDVLEEMRLVAFDREMIMGVPRIDQIRRERALGQQSIGGDLLALSELPLCFSPKRLECLRKCLICTT